MGYHDQIWEDFPCHLNGHNLSWWWHQSVQWGWWSQRKDNTWSVKHQDKRVIRWQYLSPDKPPGCRHVTAPQTAFTHCVFEPCRLIGHFQINFTSCLSDDGTFIFGRQPLSYFPNMIFVFLSSKFCDFNIRTHNALLLSKKHRKNCERLSWIQVLNCEYCYQCLKCHKSLWLLL